MNTTLPDAFKQLEHLVPEWAIEDGHQRYLKRVNSDMETLKSFHDQVLPYGEAAIDHIDQYDYREPLPEPAANLRNLIYSLITVSLAVELWRQPRVKNSAQTILTRLS